MSGEHDNCEANFWLGMVRIAVGFTVLLILGLVVSYHVKSLLAMRMGYE